MDSFLKVQNRHTGETLRLRRVRDAAGQIVLNIDGSLPPRASGPPPHVHFHQREEGSVKAGTLGAQGRSGDGATQQFHFAALGRAGLAIRVVGTD